MSTTDAYVAAVRSLIQHLPTVEREEILEDLTAQLNEEAAEAGGALEDRLGTPSAFAAEFVESLGGNAARTATEPVPVQPSPARRWWTDARPAWWMLRPFVIVGAVVLIVGRHAEDGLTRLVLLGLGAVAAAATVAWSNREGSVGGTRNLAWTAGGIASVVAVALALVTGSAVRTLHVQPAHVAAVEMKCAMAAKDRAIGPALDDPKAGGGKLFVSPDLPPLCRRFPFVVPGPTPAPPDRAPLPTAPTTQAPEPSSTTTTPQPATTTTAP
jgi:hypothetical protein